MGATGMCGRVQMARRGVILGLLVGLCALAGWLLAVHGPQAPFWPKCLLHQWTGWHCPGCGMTRASAACLHGEFAQAFRYNPVVMVLLPLLLVAVCWELAGWVRGRPMPVRLLPGPRVGLALLGLLLVFGILRNLPYWPFTLLAPP